MAIAIACLRLFTFLPEPERSVPRFYVARPRQRSRQVFGFRRAQRHAEEIGTSTLSGSAP